MNTKETQGIEIGERIKLPEPRYTSNTSIEEALSQRRSIRAYSGENLFAGCCFGSRNGSHRRIC